MGLVYWIGAFVIGVVAQAIASESASFLDRSSLWFLGPPVRFLAGAAGLWLWLLVGYPIWSLARGKPPIEKPLQLLGLALAIAGIATVIGVLLESLQGIRALAVIRPLLNTVRSAPFALAWQELQSGVGTLAALLLGLGAILGGGYLGRKG